MQWAALQSHSLPKGAFCFHRQNSSVSGLANRFHGHVAATGHFGALPPVLDFEDTRAKPSLALVEWRCAITTIGCIMHSEVCMDQKFWRRVNIRGADECWEYTGTPSQRYGKYNIKIGGKWRLAIAHRYAYEQYYGKIPDGLYVCHSCDNPMCCNPEHLFLGTNSTNQKHAVQNGLYANVCPPEPIRGEEHHSAKLSEDDVREIRRLYGAGAYSQDELAEKYGLAQNMIHKIVRRKSWRHVK